MTRVAVLDDYQGAAARHEAWTSLPDSVEVVFFADHAPDADALVARLRNFEVVVAMRERSAFPRDVLARLPELKLLVTTAWRNAAIEMEAAAELGVVVCGTGAHLAGTPELTWGLILAVLRHIPLEHASIRAGAWQQRVGGDLAGATLGLIGLGTIGAYVARVAQAFDMRVIAWSHNLTRERCAEVGAELVTKDELLSGSDVVSIHLVLSDRTHGLIGADELALMKPTAILVNTSRGPIVDEGALATTLREGRIAGAGLDVYDHEPLPPDHPFRHLPNLVTTPHIGYVTAKTYEVFMRETCEDVVAYLEGEPIRVLNQD
jgi:phosphoglycerate dehydrogenase-like enzyme